MSSYTLRAMTADDYDALMAFWEKQTGIGLNESDTRHGIAAYLQRNPGLSLVAFDGDALIGAVLCGHDGRRGSMNHLAVAETHRGKGIGRAMVESCLDKLHALGIPRCNIFVFADNGLGDKFWQAMKYVDRKDLKIMQRVTAVA